MLKIIDSIHWWFQNRNKLNNFEKIFLNSLGSDVGLIRSKVGWRLGLSLGERDGDMVGSLVSTKVWYCMQGVQQCGFLHFDHEYVFVLDFDCLSWLSEDYTFKSC